MSNAFAPHLSAETGAATAELQRDLASGREALRRDQERQAQLRAAETQQPVRPVARPKPAAEAPVQTPESLAAARERMERDKKMTAGLQADLAAGRAKLQEELANREAPKGIDGWSAPAVPVTVHATATRAASAPNTDSADERERLRREREAGIAFAVDREGMQNDRSGTPRRTARVRCHDCGAETMIHQAQDTSTGTFIPDAAGRLVAFGWRQLEAHGLWMCGGVCFERAKHKMAQHNAQPLPPVTRVNDQSYAKNMYATPPAAQETTPAAPIAIKAAAVVAAPTPPAPPAQAPQAPAVQSPSHAHGKHHRR